MSMHFLSDSFIHSHVVAKEDIESWAPVKDRGCTVTLPGPLHSVMYFVLCSVGGASKNQFINSDRLASDRSNTSW
jgi:hypothetical protein